MKFLVPLDGTSFSEAILDPIARAARPLHASVELLCVRRPEEVRETPATGAVREITPVAGATGTPLNVPSAADMVPPAAETREQAVERAEAELHDYLLARSRTLDGIPTEIRAVFADDPAAAIIREAKASGSDIIAMATHGRTGLSHLLSGSVAEKVIRSGVAPVLVLRPERAG